MCWEIDYKFLAEQKKAQETRLKQEHRAGLIDRLLNEASRQGEKTPKKCRSKRLHLQNRCAVLHAAVEIHPGPSSNY